MYLQLCFIQAAALTAYAQNVKRAPQKTSSSQQTQTAPGGYMRSSRLKMKVSKKKICNSFFNPVPGTIGWPLS
jgi:hypothetical protein